MDSFWPTPLALSQDGTHLNYCLVFRDGETEPIVFCTPTDLEGVERKLELTKPQLQSLEVCCYLAFDQCILTLLGCAKMCSTAADMLKQARTSSASGIGWSELESQSIAILQNSAFAAAVLSAARAAVQAYGSLIPAVSREPVNWFRAPEIW